MSRANTSRLSYDNFPDFMLDRKSQHWGTAVPLTLLISPKMITLSYSKQVITNIIVIIFSQFNAKYKQKNRKKVLLMDATYTLRNGWQFTFLWQKKSEKKKRKKKKIYLENSKHFTLTRCSTRGSIITIFHPNTFDRIRFIPFAGDGSMTEAWGRKGCRTKRGGKLFDVFSPRSYIHSPLGTWLSTEADQREE